MQNNIWTLVEESFKPIFDAYDKDKNSSLQKNQLKSLLADNLGVPQESITQEQLDWHFDKIDHNKDGKITFTEYFTHFFGERAKNCRKQQNQDELIDKEQFKKLLKDTFAPIKVEITQQMVDWNFDQIDTDKSGRISFDEYMKFIKKYNS